MRTSLNIDNKTLKLSGEALARHLFQEQSIEAVRAAKFFKFTSDIADELSEISIIKDARSSLMDQWDILLEQFQNFSSSWQKKIIPQATRNKLNYQTSGQMTYSDVWAALQLSILFVLINLKKEITQENINDAREALSSLEKIIQDAETLSISLADLIDATNSRLRKKMKEQDIWDLILDCAEGTFKRRFEDSLDDWWGAKKWIILSVCGLTSLTTIIATAGAVVAVEIVKFLVCFIRGMVGGYVSLAADIAECIIKKA